MSIQSTRSELLDIILRISVEFLIIIVSDVLLKHFFGSSHDAPSRRIYNASRIHMFMAQEVILLISIVALYYVRHNIAFVLIVAVVGILVRIFTLYWYTPQQLNSQRVTRVISKPLSHGYSTDSVQKQLTPLVYSTPQSTQLYLRRMYQCTQDSKPTKSCIGVASKGAGDAGRSKYPQTEGKLMLGLHDTFKRGVYNLWSNSLHSHSPGLSPRNQVPVTGTELSKETRHDIDPTEAPPLYPLPSTTPPGLINNGNACFINSTMQCLTWTPGFVDSLPKFSSLKSNESTFLRNLHDVFILCHAVPDGETEHMLVPITPLLSSISKLAPHLVAEIGSIQYQQDAAEFLLWLLDHLHSIIQHQSKGKSGLETVFTETQLEGMRRDKESCLARINKIGSGDLQALTEPMTNLSDLDWDLHWQEHSSILYKIFLGQLLEARECRNCKRVTMSIEYFTLLPLPLPVGNNGGTLLDCFSRFREAEELVSDNMVYCSCSQEDALKPATRLALLSVVPKCLILQLSRFSYDSKLHAALKNDAPVYFPQQMDLFPHTMKAKLDPKQKSTMIYELRGFCAHSGAQSTSYGHYVAFCKAKDHKWYNFNDHNVTLITDIDPVLKSDFVTHNAYLLFYHNIQQ